MPIFHTSISLRPSDHPPQDLPRHVADATLESLAKQWWLIQGKDPREDANALLCADDPNCSLYKLSDITQNVLQFDSPNAVMVYAIVERVKRACWMALHHYLYDQALLSASEQKTEDIQVTLDPKKPQPSGTALPPVPKAVLDQVLSS